MKGFDPLIVLFYFQKHALEFHSNNAGIFFIFSQEMIIWSDLVYRCNDHVPEVIYNELPPRLQAEVEIDTTRPPAPVVQARKKRKKRSDDANGEQHEELFDDDEL